jgi:LPS sulfotransferase NodH
MEGDFDYFVVLAEMRTGSNFLESNLNAFARLVCHGEAFNPHFIGYPKSSEILGVTQETRDRDPARLINAIRTKSDGLGGFRFFHDHDPRAFDLFLPDPRCAKIILTRNPLDSYVSWKIAQATGQWKLTDLKRRKDGKAVFDADEFADHLNVLQSFQISVLHGLQTTGQTAFYLSYEDLQDLEVMNGLGRFLGQDDILKGLEKKLKKQNPEPTADKVVNRTEMISSVAGLDWFNLSRTPNFEPRRGPVVPSYVAAAKARLLYLPMRGSSEGAVIDWMAKLDGVAQDDLKTRMNQKDLRQWKRQNAGHRSFTVVRHPVARAHSVFCERILNVGEGGFAQIRQTLKNRYKVPLPQDPEQSGYDRAAHRTAFVAFLEFLRGNLAGQTAIRVDTTWCTQSQALQGFGEFVLPDYVLRENELASALPALAMQYGYQDPPAPNAAGPDTPFALSDIYDEQIEQIVADIYQRDYMMFGFSEWGSGHAA